MNLYWVLDKTEKIFLTSDLWLGSDLSYTNQIMYAPTISFTIPISVIKGKKKNDYIPDSAFEFVIEFDSGRIFHGIVTRKSYDLIAGTVTIDGEHVVNELTHYRIPTNFAINDKSFNEIYNPEGLTEIEVKTETSESESSSESSSESQSEDSTSEQNSESSQDSDKTESSEEENKEETTTVLMDLTGKFNHEGWTFSVMEDIEDVKFTYLFSNQDKLQALTDACRQTEDVFWRVSLTEMRTIEIGRFGDYKELMINESNMLGSAFGMEEDFQDIVNYGIYFTDKSDSGTTALTLRDVFNRPELQDENFPIILTGQEINTERNYGYVDLIPFGANNQGDYAVLDVEGIALESGNIYEGAFTSNDVQSVAENNKEITDADRLEASKQLYKQAIRKLIHSRRKVAYNVKIADLSPEYNVGDKVRFTMISQILEVSNCSNYYEKLLWEDDYFYISSMTETVLQGGGFNYDLTLEKFLYNNEEV